MSTFHLPKLFCPFTPAIHPRIEEIEKESLERWAGILGLHAKHKAFRKLQVSRFPVLIGGCHPAASDDGLRLVVDFAIWLFLWDDQFDSGVVSPDWVRQQNDMAVEILNGTAMLDHDAPPLFWILSDIRDRLVAQMPEAWMKRFTRSCVVYFEGCAWEAETRVNGTCPDVETYIHMRRLTSGAYPMIDLIEAADGIRLNEEIWSNPIIKEMIELTNDQLGWANDFFSLGGDLKDDGHLNLVFSIQKQEGMELQEAINTSVDMHDKLIKRLLELEQQLPSFGEKDADVAAFVQGMFRWIRSNIDWSILTGRYQESDAELPASESIPDAA
jgi:5-epi-alpha-selinene synthase